LPDEDTAESREGSDLHSFLAHPEYERSVLKPHLQELLKTADQLDAELFAVVIQNEKILDSEEFVEAREIEDERDATFCGHVDFVRRYPKRSLTIIRDAKFGYVPVERAELNLQLRGYAAMSGDDIVYVAITQPRAPFNQRLTIAKYTQQDVLAARNQINAIIAATEDPNAPLHAGVHCRYCRARAMCPELLRAVRHGLAPMEIMPAEISKTAKLARVEARLAQIPDEDLSKMLDAYTLVQFIYDPMMEEARRRIQDGKLDGWKLSKALERRKIINSQRAIALLSLAGMNRDDIMECANLSLTKLEDKLNHGKLRTGQHITGAKDAREFTTRVLSSVLELETGKQRVLKK
jgi:hypothetical protein